MINIGDNEISAVYLGSSEITAIYAGDELLYPMNLGTLTGIAIENLEWVKDVPADGGTATSANCSFNVYAYYDSGKSKRVTKDSTITGSLVVPATTAETREMVGTLTLTASYSGFTDSDTVDVYQAKYSVGPASITTYNALININYTANTSTRIEVKMSCVSDADNRQVFGSYGVWHSANSYFLNVMNNGSYRFYVGGYYNDNALTGITEGKIVKGEFSTSGFTFYDENDNVLNSATYSPRSYSPNYGFGIGKVISANQEVGANNTFYYFKIYEDNTLVRDLIPWEENGYGCLKDELTGNIYYGDTPSNVVANFD